MYLSTSVSSGKTDVVIKRWCSHRMPIEDLWNAEWLYELFNKDGRFIVSLQDILKMMNPSYAELIDKLFSP